MTDQPIIQFKDFSFHYGEGSGDGNWALRDIDLCVEPGEIVLILGRSGCGKSTLGLAVAGIVPHLLEGTTEGNVAAAGLSVKDTSVFEMSKHVGVVFQDPEVQLFALTVEDEVAMSLESYSVPRDEMRERVDWAISVCGLTGIELDAPAKLSGGQKQRVAIAAVIAREPEILVFDEPTGNLDPVGTRSVYQVVRRICEEQGTTVVLIEHDLAPVIDIVNKVVVLEEGEIIFRGTPREVMLQQDLLRTIGVKIPVATRLGLRLANRGLVQYPRPPLLPEETLEPIRRILPSGWAESPQARAPTQASDGADSDEGQEEPVVSLRSVTHRYATGTVALDNVDLDIRPGEFVAIVGMNGAGKTTLALHVMGILSSTEGEVYVGGTNTREKSVAELAQDVGLIFQNPNHQLFKDTVEGELRFGPENLGWDEDEIQASMKRVLELVELRGTERSDPESLSTGQKKRVAIASTLIMNPKVLLLDEPTTGQDQRTLAPILDLVTRLHQEGMTVLMITHDMEVVMDYASRMVVMADGRIIADGSPREVFLREEVLRQAQLYLPEVLHMAAVLNDGMPFWVGSVDALEDRLLAATGTAAYV